MGRQANLIRNENGGVLIVVAVLLLALLTILGISSINTSRIESKISVNDHLQKMAFYEADGGTQAGIQLLEENLACPGGFNNEPTDINGTIRVTNRDFYTNALPNATTAILNCPSNTQRDAYYPVNYSGSEPHTNLRFFGRAQAGWGSAIQMASGYEGRGKGAGAGGGWVNYSIHAQRIGLRNGQSHVMVQWRHVIGQRGECRY
jgi:Tfp pilus assembly protein PilX